MTIEQFKSLKEGDILSFNETGQEFILRKDSFTMTTFDGTPLINIRTLTKNGSYQWLPYFYYELELVVFADIQKKCVCDIMLLMRLGCQCSGK